MASERMNAVDEAAYRVAEAASDYKLAHQSEEFCRLNGGLDAIREKLLSVTVQWEYEMTEHDAKEAT